MNRPTHIQKAKSLAQRYNKKVSDDDDGIDDIQIGQPSISSEKVSKFQSNLFDKINKMFDDPTIKHLKDFDHEDFLNKENGLEDSLPPLAGKPKSKSMASSGKDVLDKAKQLLEKNKNEIPQMKERQQQIKKKVTIKEKQTKENTFVTGLGLYQQRQEEEEEEEIQKVPIKEDQEGDDDDDDDDDENDYEDFDENEYLKKLQGEELDDLAELRIMIAKTKKEIQGYAGEVYNLKNSISDLNIGYKGVGFGVDEDLFSEMDREFNRYMPGGDTNKLFDDIGNKNRTSQAILAGKKGIKKNNLMGGSSSISGTNGSISGTTSSIGIRKPPIIRQPVLEKVFGSKVPELQPISNAKKQMRSTFY